MINVDLPAPLSPITAEDFARQELEIGLVERRDVAVALDEACAPADDGLSRSCRHPPDPLIERDGDDDQNADGEFLPKHVKPASERPERNTPTINAPISVPTIEPRPPNRLVPPITTAVMRVEIGVLARGGADRADAADDRPAGHRRNEAGQDINAEQDVLGVDAGEARRLGIVARRVDVTAVTVRLSTYQATIAKAISRKVPNIMRAPSTLNVTPIILQERRVRLEVVRTEWFRSASRRCSGRR